VGAFLVAELHHVPDGEYSKIATFHEFEQSRSHLPTVVSQRLTQFVEPVTSVTDGRQQFLRVGISDQFEARARRVNRYEFSHTSDRFLTVKTATPKATVRGTVTRRFTR
jgi:hypothetical protein